MDNVNEIKQDLTMSGSLDAIADALSKAQSELDTSKKDKTGYGYNYSDLASVISTAKPILAKNGLSISQLIGKTESSNASVTTLLLHKSGQYLKSDASIPIIQMKGTNAAQNFGASVSYLRRYTLQAILNMASEDNDASSNGLSKPERKAPVKAAAKVEVEVAKDPKNNFRKSKAKQVQEQSTDDLEL